MLHGHFILETSDWDEYIYSWGKHVYRGPQSLFWWWCHNAYFSPLALWRLTFGGGLKPEIDHIQNGISLTGVTPA